MVNEVQVVINSAASVDFNARLDDAIQANIVGSLRVYSLAKKMIKLENFLHISTSYVNSNRKDGVVEEEIYYDQDKEDAQITIDRMLSMQLDEVNKNWFYIHMNFIKILPCNKSLWPTLNLSWETTQIPTHSPNPLQRKF